MTTDTRFDRLWESHFADALQEVKSKAHLDRDVSHELLASMRAYQQIVGRMPTTVEALAGPKALRTCARFYATGVA